MIGKDNRGHWVVQDQHHLRGRLFINRAEALRFAMFENGNRPKAAIMMPGVIESTGAGRYLVCSRRGIGRRKSSLTSVQPLG
jgi:hypothetical protein